MDPLLIIFLFICFAPLFWAGVMFILFGLRMYLSARGNYVLEDWF